MATNSIETSGIIYIGPNTSKDLRTPVIQLKFGFHAALGLRFTAGIPSFKVYFVNMMDPDSVGDANVFARGGDPNKPMNGDLIREIVDPVTRDERFVFKNFDAIYWIPIGGGL